MNRGLNRTNNREQSDGNPHIEFTPSQLSFLYYIPYHHAKAAIVSGDYGTCEIGDHDLGWSDGSLALLVTERQLKPHFVYQIQHYRVTKIKYFHSVNNPLPSFIRSGIFVMITDQSTDRKLEIIPVAFNKLSPTLKHKLSQDRISAQQKEDEEKMTDKKNINRLVSVPKLRKNSSYVLFDSRGIPFFLRLDDNLNQLLSHDVYFVNPSRYPIFTNCIVALYHIPNQAPQELRCKHIWEQVFTVNQDFTPSSNRQIPKPDPNVDQNPNLLEQLTTGPNNRKKDPSSVLAPPALSKGSSARDQNRKNLSQNGSNLLQQISVAPGESIGNSGDDIDLLDRIAIKATSDSEFTLMPPKNNSCFYQEYPESLWINLFAPSRRNFILVTPAYIEKILVSSKKVKARHFIPFLSAPALSLHSSDKKPNSIEEFESERSSTNKDKEPLKRNKNHVSQVNQSVDSIDRSDSQEFKPPQKIFKAKHFKQGHFQQRKQFNNNNINRNGNY